MARRRNRLAWGLGLWTVGIAVTALVLAGVSVARLAEAQQSCFFNYPAIPCPGPDDPMVGLLTFALVGLPLGGMAGAAAITIAWMFGHRRTGDVPPS